MTNKKLKMEGDDVVRAQLVDATWNWDKYRSICIFNLGRANAQSNYSRSYSEEEGQKHNKDKLQMEHSVLLKLQ